MSKYYPHSTIKRRVSYEKKIANNYKRAIELIDLYDFGQFHNTYDEKRREKLRINYDLANGRMDTSIYDEGPCMVIGGEEIYDDSYTIEHYPVAAQVFQNMYGEHINRPFNLTVKDLSPIKHTYESKELDRLLKEYVSMNIIEPLRQNIQNEYLIQAGVSDPFSLSPEDQKQAQQDINRRVVAMTPKEIIDYMENDFRTPVAKQAQEVIKYLSEKFKLRQLQSEGFKDAVIMAELYYYVDVHNDDLIMEHVTPKSLTYGGSQETEWVQEMTWAKRERYLTIEDTFDKYGEYFNKANIDTLDKYVTPIPGGPYDEAARDNSAHTKAFILETSDTENLKMYEKAYGELNKSTGEGQANIVKVWNKVAEKYNLANGKSGFGIRETHICYRDLAEFKKVERLENGEIKKYWLKGHYEPADDDISVTKHWFSEVWQGTKLGDHQEALYVKIEPYKYQYQIWSLLRIILGLSRHSYLD